MKNKVAFFLINFFYYRNQIGEI